MGNELQVSRLPYERPLDFEKLESDEVSRERHITFHAWRHFLNSLMRSNGVSDAKTRRVTGHRTAAMTEWYTSWAAVDISEVVTIQEGLLTSGSGQRLTEGQ